MSPSDDTKMREYVDDTEDYINIIMDDKQNQLLQFGVVMSTALVMLDVAGVIAGLLSMNFDIPLFAVGIPRQFYEATAVTVGGCTFIFFIAIMWFKRKGLLG
ncbi:unnamed protein product [Ilex paraguariensis]|uniref:Magnesium transporter n=1 Tax=Ilex paraguariensis TaxID=185542 RepID=A0ABC8RIY9_9AQUA